jgi:plastocyanin
MRKRTSIRLAATAFVIMAGTAGAAEWGDLTATFVYDGPPPKAADAKITSDREFCTQFHVIDESLLVDAESGGVANVIMYVYVGRGKEKPPVHESYAETAQAKVSLDNQHCRFAPHVVPLRTSQTLVVENSDAIGHNTNFAFLSNPGFNELIPTGGKKELQIHIEERVPVKVACNIHPWMVGWLVVKEHPYIGVSDKQGRLEIKQLPAGEWTFQMWHEKVGYLRELSFDGGTTDRGGRFTVTIKPGTNDLGQFKLPPSLFE